MIECLNLHKHILSNFIENPGVNRLDKLLEKLKFNFDRLQRKQSCCGSIMSTLLDPDMLADDDTRYRIVHDAQG